MNRSKCTKCKEHLNESMFYKDKRKRNGLDSACKLCRTTNKRFVIKRIDNG